ncbi:PLP-dependent cysteine synthase family protein [Fodinibius saliphilus]|uniref:PLP-dependent cysteine synthase family protein n=1 Tax=Fodinibius saliphilus TaxID=1920650 RepID=UPI001108A8E4|nr:cysteine synthase family protein [Fodinibius saliphilus]
MNSLETISDSLLQNAIQLRSFIGHTPLYPINNIGSYNNVNIYAKLEWQQFGGSVKARAAYRIIRDAIQSGELNSDESLLDASSGNTGIAYAHIGARLGIPVTLCLPENASEERKQILKALGVKLQLTPRGGGTDEAQKVAKKMYEKYPDKYFYADQYSNPNNWKAHYDTTGIEILEQTDYEVTHFIAGLGTTGTFTGTGKRLKEYNDDISLIALQPDIAMHGLEGWKHLPTAKTPSIYNENIPESSWSVSTEKAYALIKETARKEGLLISPSSAANLLGALELAEQIQKGTIVTVFPDNGDKYGEVFNQLF